MEHTPNRPSRRSAKGQAMAIFALVSVLLFVVAGLAVDAGTSYLTSNQIERAAASAALAGVAYLPGDLPDAKNAALVEAARDGFPNAGALNLCPGSPTPSPCVITSQPVVGGVTKDNELTVTISVSVSTIFLRLVGFGSHTVVRSETAEYLPPISLGQSGSQQGSGMSPTGGCDGVPTGGTDSYCPLPTQGLGSSGNYYFERQEGWGNSRSEGDPFTPSPNQGGAGCGPYNDSCNAASAPDYHEISAEAGTVTPDSSENYAGGSNFLITLYPGQTADVQIYNPSFAPDTCNDNSTSYYCYHEDDSGFDQSPAVAPDTDYSAMEYTLYQTSTLSSRFGDTKVSQEIFYPYNATGLYNPSPLSARSYFYYAHSTGTLTTVPTGLASAYTPVTYHEWISGMDYEPTNTNDKNLYTGTNNLYASSVGGAANTYKYLSNTGTTNEYFRLEVDSLTWNGQPACPATSGPCATPSTSTDSYSEAHKGYSVRLVSASAGLGQTLGTENGSSCPSSGTYDCGSASAMDDMTVYTPVNGGNATQFSIPLFNLDPSYAGQTINVDLFDIGDVGGGSAYVGLQEPSGSPSTWAPETSMTDLGESLNGGNPPSGSATVASLGSWPGSGGGSCAACFQTSSGGGAIYNGQWVQIQMQVPQNFTTGPNAYWNLIYDVSPTATAGDTFAVQVGFNGTPDHLLP